MSQPAQGHQGKQEALNTVASLRTFGMLPGQTVLESSLGIRFKRGTPSSVSSFSIFHNVFFEGGKNTLNDANLSPFKCIKKGNDWPRLS